MAARVEDSSQLTMPEGPGATIEDKVAAMGADFECRQLEEPLHGDGYSVRIMSKDSDACGFTETGYPLRSCIPYIWFPRLR